MTPEEQDKFNKLVEIQHKYIGDIERQNDELREALCRAEEKIEELEEKLLTEPTNEFNRRRLEEFNRHMTEPYVAPKTNPFKGNGIGDVTWGGGTDTTFDAKAKKSKSQYDYDKRVLGDFMGYTDDHE